MKITLTRMEGLTAEQIAAWSRWQQADPELASPYLRPEFVRVAAAIRPGVEVALMEDGGETVGFFPFERRHQHVGVPVAAPLNDFQAVIVRPGATWSAKELIEGCRLRTFRFDHLLASQCPFVPYHWSVGPSYFMDLSRGFDVYEKERHDAGCRDFSQACRKARKAKCRLGPLRFVVHDMEESVLHALVKWKSLQYARTKMTNILEFPWILELLRRIRGTEGEAFSGMMSAVYFGDRLAAVHLGMRSRDVLHMWFPTYDPELYQYSPGMIQFMEIARAAPSLGIRRIDLGKGPEAFKIGLGSAAIPVAEGFVDRRPMARILRRGWLRTRDWLHQSPLRRPVEAMAAVVRPFRARREIGV